MVVITEVLITIFLVDQDVLTAFCSEAADLSLVDIYRCRVADLFCLTWKLLNKELLFNGLMFDS